MVLSPGVSTPKVARCEAAIFAIEHEATWHTEIVGTDGLAVQKHGIIVVTVAFPVVVKKPSGRRLLVTTALPVVVEKKRSRRRLLTTTTTARRNFGCPERDHRRGGTATTTRGPRDGSGRADEISVMTIRDATIDTEAKNDKRGSRIAAMMTKKLQFVSK